MIMFENILTSQCVSTSFFVSSKTMNSSERLCAEGRESVRAGKKDGGQEMGTR